MTKIVVVNPMDFSPAQRSRLTKLGETTFFDTHPTPEEWLSRCQGHDIICSWITGLRDHYAELHDVMISVPFVGVSSFADPEVVRRNRITLCNSPGSNRHAVSEWVIYMLLSGLRHLHTYINTQEPLAVPLISSPLSLFGKRLTILGAGHVGSRVGEICQALGMHVTYFRRGDDLAVKTHDADVVVDTLSSNPSSHGLLNKDFFASLKPGAGFISVTVSQITDYAATLAALDEGRLSFVAHDLMDIKPGDTSNPLYQQFLTHPRLLATPHISAFTDTTTQQGNDMMIDNVEAYLSGKPIHVFG